MCSAGSSASMGSFDVKFMLDRDSFTDDIKHGLIYGLASSTRPMYEMLDRNLQDQRSAPENHFNDMIDIPFSYTDFGQCLVMYQVGEGMTWEKGLAASPIFKLFISESIDISKVKVTFLFILKFKGFFL